MHLLDSITSFEVMEVKLEVNCQIVSILIVYRPPLSFANDLSNSLWLQTVNCAEHLPVLESTFKVGAPILQ